MIGKFSAYLDVSKVSLTNYLYGLRAFHSWLKTEEIARPLRSDILRYRKVMEAEYKLFFFSLILLALSGGLRTVEISRADVSDLRNNGDAEVL